MTKPDDKNSKIFVNPFEAYSDQAPQYSGFSSYSCYVPMPDGVRLAVDVYLPRNLPSGTRIPAILSQTRYWREMELRFPFNIVYKGAESLHPILKHFRPFFTSRGYALVNLDVRGTGASFGVWQIPWEAASIQDARSILDWIISQPWSNGSVGGSGVSYLGTMAELLLATQHPAVKAVYCSFNHPDAYTDMAFPGGLFNKRFIQEWGQMNFILDQNKLPDSFSRPLQVLVRGVRPVDGDRGRVLLQQAVREHHRNGHFNLVEGVTYRDEVDADIQHSVDDLTVIQHQDAITTHPAASYGWASWMDGGTADAALRRFMTFPNARRVVIGAWDHGGGKQASPYLPPGAPLSPHPFDQWKEQLRFFDAHLKGIENGVQGESVVYYYTLGEEAWHKSNTWPPAGVKNERWFFSENHCLSTQSPAEEGVDHYRVDFSTTTGMYNRWWALNAAYNQVLSYSDLSSQAAKLLNYTSPPLEEDLEISGYPVIRLFTQSNEPDVAFFVYLEDVLPDGQVVYLTEGILRSIHRKISSQPSPYVIQIPYHSFRQGDTLPLVPGETAEVTFGLNPISALIRRGHCLRVSIAGADADTFPRIPASTSPELAFFRNRKLPSSIELPIRR